MVEQAKTLFIEYVDTPYAVTYDKFGNDQVNLLPSSTGPTVPLDGYREVCVQVGTGSSGNTKSFSLSIGKISGLTLCEKVFDHQPVGTKIFCSYVKGPQAMLLLHGKANTNDKVQLWIYLRS